MKLKNMVTKTLISATLLAGMLGVQSAALAGQPNPNPDPTPTPNPTPTPIQPQPTSSDLRLTNGQTQQQDNVVNQSGVSSNSSFHQAVYPGSGFVRIGDDLCQSPTDDSRLAVSANGIWSGSSDFQTYSAGATYARTWNHTGYLGEACEKYAALQLQIQELQIRGADLQNQARMHMACAEIVRETTWVESGVMFRMTGVTLPEWCGDINIESIAITPPQTQQTPPPQRQTPPQPQNPPTEVEETPQGG